MVITNHHISLATVGCSGVGKSTICSRILKSKQFRTSGGALGCTRVPMKRSNGHVSVTDLPGIPDPEPAKTKEAYNHCITEVSKGHTAVLYVFEKGRIEPDKYKRAEILFREINRGSGEKILVINDKCVPLDDDDDTDDETALKEYNRELMEQTKAIEGYLNIVFDRYVYLKRDNMKETLENLVQALQHSEPGSKRRLRSFEEIRKFVDELQSEVQVKQALTDERRYELEDCKRTIKRARVAATLTGVGSAAATVASVLTFGATAPVAAGGFSFFGAQLTFLCHQEKRRQELTKRLNKSELDGTEAKRLMTAAREFQELARAVDASEYTA